jgi:hypothetical protein
MNDFFGSRGGEGSLPAAQTSRGQVPRDIQNFCYISQPDSKFKRERTKTPTSQQQFPSINQEEQLLLQKSNFQAFKRHLRPVVHQQRISEVNPQREESSNGLEELTKKTEQSSLLNQPQKIYADIQSARNFAWNGGQGKLTQNNSLRKPHPDSPAFGALSGGKFEKLGANEYEDVNTKTGSNTRQSDASDLRQGGLVRRGGFFERIQQSSNVSRRESENQFFNVQSQDQLSHFQVAQNLQSINSQSQASTSARQQVPIIDNKSCTIINIHLDSKPKQLQLTSQSQAEQSEGTQESLPLQSDSKQVFARHKARVIVINPKNKGSRSGIPTHQKVSLKAEFKSKKNPESLMERALKQTPSISDI